MTKSFAGAAVPTFLTTPMGTSDTSMTVNAIAGFPDTTVGDFVICVDRGNDFEEKILCSGYGTSTISVAAGGRGYDGTTAQTHSVNATVICTLDATTIQGHENFVNAVGTVNPTASAVGDSVAEGTSGKPADAAHRHAREAFLTGVVTTSLPGDTSSDGTAASSARADHRHGREAGSPSKAGIIEMFGGGTAPTGAAFCQGQALSRTSFATLFAVIGTTFGAGDGSTTFNLPDFRGVSPMGAGTGTHTGTTTRAMGAFYGAESTGHQVIHSHTVTGMTIAITQTTHTHDTDAAGNSANPSVFTLPSGGSQIQGYTGSGTAYEMFWSAGEQ
jgi:microcystin-dependent protein